MPQTLQPARGVPSAPDQKASLLHFLLGPGTKEILVPSPRTAWPLPSHHCRRSSLPLAAGAGGMDCSDSNQSAVAGLPNDIFLEILSRVALDLPRFKCVAKAWCCLIDELMHRKEHPRTLRGFFFMDEVIWNWGNGGGSDDGIRGFLNLLPSVPLSIDATFSFLTEMPGIDTLCIVATCNGLLLFEHTDGSDGDFVLGYIVYNPATKQLKHVCPPRPRPSAMTRSTHLVFDPAVSSNFYLIQFLVEVDDDDDDDKELKREILSVHTYSSETGKWSQQDTKEEQEQLKGWSSFIIQKQLGAFVNSMLHAIVNVDFEDRVFAVDVQGKIHKIIPLPGPTKKECYIYGIPHTSIARSKGSLHFVDKGSNAQLSIWVLEDYKAQQWVLKDTVSYLELFGKHNCKPSDFHVIAVHQDCNVVFFRYKKHLISYDMDNKAVRIVGSFEETCRFMPVVPYVPYFESITNE